MVSGIPFQPIGPNCFPGENDPFPPWNIGGNHAQTCFFADFSPVTRPFVPSTMNSKTLSTNPEEEIRRLRQQVAQLKRFQKATQMQHELMSTFVMMAPRASGTLLLRSLLRQTLETFVKLTDSAESSLFWLNGDGLVEECILARGVVIREQKDTVVGKVLQGGLAGWVYDKRAIGFVPDTEKDDRWLQLPNQPYVTRSVLCLPILRNTRLLSIITLMHPEANHFTPDQIPLLELVSEQIAIVLDFVRFYQDSLENNPFSSSYEPTKRRRSLPTSPQEAPFSLEDLDHLGLFILDPRGNFVYANQRLALKFEYSFSELVAVQSFYKLVAPEDHANFVERYETSFQGKNNSLSLQVKGVTKTKKEITLNFHGHRTKLYGKWVFLGMLQGDA